MANDLQALQDAALEAVADAHSLETLEQCRIQFLGKQGHVTQRLKSLGALEPAERKAEGARINQVKQALLGALTEKTEALKHAAREQQLAEEKIDVSLPGRGPVVGNRHPVTRSMERIEAYFTGLGFIVAQGPEIEDQFHNFEALNIPETHPARQTQDTFYFNDGNVLRTHTSPVQIRVMQHSKPPLRVIAPGRVYRCDSDVTHTPMFHQLEGFMVDESVTMAQLKGILQDFLNYFFEQDCQIRFRPSYFPFTEPSAEVDMLCVYCYGKAACRVCSNTGWLEVLGCGMVHPNVLTAVDIDSTRYQGFAFGVGIDRLTMLRYGINDLRLLFDNDMRLLKQF